MEWRQVWECCGVIGRHKIHSGGVAFIPACHTQVCHQHLKHCKHYAAPTSFLLLLPLLCKTGSGSSDWAGLEWPISSSGLGQSLCMLSNLACRAGLMQLARSKATSAHMSEL